MFFLPFYDLSRRVSDVFLWAAGSALGKVAALDGLRSPRRRRSNNGRFWSKDGVIVEVDFQGGQVAAHFSGNHFSPDKDFTVHQDDFSPT
jgi:hypothetical protein